MVGGWFMSKILYFLLTFNNIHADLGCWVGLEKVQECADVILGCSLVELLCTQLLFANSGSFANTQSRQPTYVI